MRNQLWIALAASLAASCASTDANCAACPPASSASPATGAEAAADDAARVAIEAVLDDFHLAASEPDGERYFGHLAADAVFLGTDATERWTRDEFAAYCEPYFSSGRGWTYEPTERHVSIGPNGTTAWFDERLWNESYGETRGSGALVLDGGTWRITQYNLTIPVPNELAKELVEKIRAREGE